MAQHNDLVIDDDDGAGFLADINSLLTAILTCNSGDTAPATKVPYMFWAQGSTDTLWQRNANNDGWIDKAKLSQAFNYIAPGTITKAMLAPELSLETIDSQARNAIARLDFTSASQHSLDRQDNDNGITDVYTDESDIDTGASVNESYSASGGSYSGIGPVGADTTPTMTSATAPSGTVTFSSENSATNAAWKVFDKSTATEFITAASGIPGWIAYEFSTATAIGAYTITGPSVASAARAPKDFTFEGWNGSSWVVLDTQTSQTSWSNFEKRTFTLGANANYSKYRINITAVPGTAYIQFAEMEFLAAGAALNMTLQSAAFTADAAPSTVDLYIWQEDVDAVTLNTDLKGFVSRDSGTNWTEVTLVEVNSMTAGRMLSAVAVDISAQPSGTSLKYKIVTFNTKGQHIHGVSLQWRA